MANIEQDNGAGSAPTTPATQATPAFKGASRRRFTRAGVAATGVILSLKSQPGMACEVCKSPSGYQSITNASHAPRNDNLVCRGRLPSYWDSCSSTTWPVSTTKYFRDVFTGCGSSSPYYNFTLLDVVRGFSITYDKRGKEIKTYVADPTQFGKYIVAAYLNAKKNWTSFLPYQKVLLIWSEYNAPATRGTYQPGAGEKRWDAAKIVDYLRRTQD